jgi:hypothetical protein
MVPYTIDLLNEDGSVHQTRAVLCEHDGAAMDHARKINHWQAIDVWDGERCVGRVSAAASPTSATTIDPRWMWLVRAVRTVPRASS